MHIDQCENMDGSEITPANNGFVFEGCQVL